MEKENGDEAQNFLDNIKKKYSYENEVFSNYYANVEGLHKLDFFYCLFKTSLSSFKIIEKFDEIEKRYQKLTKNDKDEEDKILGEINNLIRAYNKIIDESKENYNYYHHVIYNACSHYRDNSWKSGFRKIYDDTSTEIISLLNNNYINYEKQLINIIDKLKVLNLRLNN